MRDTKEISVVLNEDTLKAIEKIKLRHGSPHWMHFLKEKAKEGYPEVSLISCIDNFEEGEEREKASLHLTLSLNRLGLTYYTEILNTLYRNIKTPPLKKLKINNLETRV